MTLTNAEIIERVAEWQGFGYVHPLTCGMGRCRMALEGREREGRAVLECPVCGFVQEWIPPVVISDYVRRTRAAMAAARSDGAV